jgi:hypothetical protein
LSNRDDIFWDESGDVLLITKDKIAVLFQKTLLLQYSETARSALGHIAKQPQYDRWMPVLELGCNATELRDVLEYLLSQKQYVLLLSIRLGRLVNNPETAQTNTTYRRFPRPICILSLYLLH